MDGKMKFDGFELHATPHIDRAYCKDCGNGLIEVSNGLLSTALYCPDCENVYTLKLIKVPSKKISAEYIKQCKKEIMEK